MPTDAYDAFLADLPKVHTWDGGKTWNAGGFGANALAALRKSLEAELAGVRPVIAETGAGNSTIMFLFMKPKHVYSISVDADVYPRVVEYCEKAGVAHDMLEYTVGRSEAVLPEFAAGLRAKNVQLDIALMDGGHGWPTVFVDFCYLNAGLRKGGLLIVDDLQIYAVNEFARWLARLPQFELVLNLKKVLIFRKSWAFDYLSDFGAQPYIVERTKARQTSADPYDFGE
jgi:methyltransferase family protein